MKHRFTTTHFKQKDCQLSGQQLVKTVLSGQKLNSAIARLWYLYFGTCMVFLFIDYLKKGKTIKSDYYMNQMSAAFNKKGASHAKEKSAIPPKKCIVPQVHENDGQIE